MLNTQLYHFWIIKEEKNENNEKNMLFNNYVYVSLYKQCKCKLCISVEYWYTGGILLLNNYNGGEIKLERIGTGLNHVFAIKLIGDNKIIAKGEEGIITNASELIFIGDGQLTINAKKPITGGKVDNNLFLNTNIVIGSLNETSNDKTIDKDISGNDKIIDKNISKFDIAIISYSCVCTITLFNVY